MRHIDMHSHWGVVYHKFCKMRISVLATGILLFLALIGIYAPFFASSKPLVIVYDNEVFFPLFRYLFYHGFYTKRLDIFFNIMMFSLPLFILALCFVKRYRNVVIGGILLAHLILFINFGFRTPHDPAKDSALCARRQHAVQEQLSDGGLLGKLPTAEDWSFSLHYMTSYEKLNMIVRYMQRREQHERLTEKYWEGLSQTPMPTLWQVDLDNENQRLASLEESIMRDRSEYYTAQEQLTILSEEYRSGNLDVGAELIQVRDRIRIYEFALTKAAYIVDKRQWLEEESTKVFFCIMPFLRSFHWEDDAGGEQDINIYVDWWELTRVNRKDLVAALLFGTRISLVVGLLAVALQLCIGLPIGSLAGYFGGKVDIIVTRLVEIWEAMPTFFMLLMVVAVLQNKSIFLVISVLGIFGWTGYCRFVRSEVLKQRHLPYVDACHAVGFSTGRIVFFHILPNALPPILTLLPFSIMTAITSEAGLSFLGLGEEGSCSWGVLMDEGRGAFPGESYLLWPPAIALTVLLISVAIIGDTFRDAIDPKSQR